MENKRVDLDKHLSPFTDDIRTLARDLRNMILKLDSDLDEVIKWNNLIYEKNGLICAIVVHRDYINLEFAHGIELLDPDGMLEGTGKKMRHVKIRNSEEIKSEKLTNLIQEALDLATDKKRI
jgi:hypothetical protein